MLTNLFAMILQALQGFLTVALPGLAIVAATDSPAPAPAPAPAPVVVIVTTPDAVPVESIPAPVESGPSGYDAYAEEAETQGLTEVPAPVESVPAPVESVESDDCCDLPPGEVDSFTTSDVRPCQSEDGADVSCFWDSRATGNGQGWSFYVDADGGITYATADEYLPAGKTAADAPANVPPAGNPNGPAATVAPATATGSEK